MRSRVVWNISVSEDMPERMAMAKSVLGANSYNNVLDYFLTAFEKQFADEIEIRKNIAKKPELELEKPAAEPLF